MAIFQDRHEAGKLLAKKLTAYTHQSNVLVLALPRGGLPIAVEISKSLKVPMDIFLVRKLGAPGYEELAMGAIAQGDVMILNQDVIDFYGIRPEIIDHIVEKEKKELLRRNQLYRGNRPLPDLKDHTLILVDDGIATGATMHVAIKAVKKMHPKKVIVAVPVAAPPTLFGLRSEVNDIVCLYEPEDFSGVSQWYRKFDQLSDEEVFYYLNKSQKVGDEES